VDLAAVDLAGAARAEALAVQADSSIRLGS
jgi:hypothetical protein